MQIGRSVPTPTPPSPPPCFYIRKWFWIRIKKMCCVRHTFPSRIIHSSCGRALICCHRWEGITNSSVLFQTQQTMVIIHKQKGPLQGKSQHVIKFRFRGALKAAAWLSASGEKRALGTVETALESHFNIISPINQPHHRVINGPRQCVPVRSLPLMH